MWRQSGASLGGVPSIQVKDVPDDVHATLRRHAAAAGKSLQEYLLERLTADAARPTLDEVLDHAGSRAGGHVSFADAAAAVRADRERAVIVVDASVVVTALADDGPDGDRTRDRIRGEHMVAPHVLDLEVTSAWRRLAPRVRSTTGGRRSRSTICVTLRIERVPHAPLLARCWELRSTLTVYDAAYVALAEVVDAVLLTGDQKLARAPGPRCAIEVLG